MKYIAFRQNQRQLLSLPARGAWVEIGLILLFAGTLAAVAPREGGVG